MAEVAKYKGVTLEHEHYMTLKVPNRGKWYLPIIHVAGYRRTRGGQFRRARDAEAWALRFERKLSAGAYAPPLLYPAADLAPFAPVVPLKWYRRLWVWLVMFVKRAAMRRTLKGYRE